MSSRWEIPGWEREVDEEEAFGVPRDYDVFIPPVAIARLPARAGIRTRILGSYRSYCRGFIVRGPQPFIFFLNTTLFLILLGVICLQFEDISKVVGVGFWYGGLALYLFALIAFFVVALTDPGVVPMHYTIQNLIRDTIGYQKRNPGARFYRFCTQCEGFRPPRCYHCKICKICIRGQQFHSIVAGTCIGHRNVGAYLTLSFLLGIFTWYLIVVNSLILSKTARHPIAVKPIFLGVIGLMSGIMLALLPNIGFFSFFYTLWGLLTGKHTRVFFEARRADELDCPKDEMSVLERFKLFLDKPKSAFRTLKRNQVGNFGRMSLGFLENLDGWLDSPPAGIGGSTDSREIIQMHLSRNQGPHEDIINLPPPPRPCEVSPEEAEEALLLRALAANARLRQTPSVPDLDRSKRETPCCFRKSPASKKRRNTPISKSKAVKQRQVTPITAAERCPEESKGVVTLSDGNIPSTLNGEELIQTARAEQFRRLIHLILIRDRNGILQMSRRVNLAGLLGLERFDPDNLQFVELSNGLPMIAPRRREPQAAQNAIPHRFGGLLGIPQMVAAGLLPTARAMAQDVENSLGLRPGTVIRVNNTVTLPHPPPAAARESMNPRRTGSTPLTSRASVLPTAERQFSSRHTSLRNQAEDQLRRLLTDQRRLLYTQEETLRALRSLNENERRPSYVTRENAVHFDAGRPSGSGIVDSNNNARSNIASQRHGTYYSTHEPDSSSSDE